MKTILILGGARSGKSRYALELARESEGNVLFVATATASDEEMQERIDAHKKQRPTVWRTLEVSADIGEHIKRNIECAHLIIIDCITLLIGNIFEHQPDPENLDVPMLEKTVEKEINSLIEIMGTINATFIIVSNEVGLGLVPSNPLGRSYRDLLGRTNQMLAQAADEVYFMVAGLPITIKSRGSSKK